MQSVNFSGAAQRAVVSLISLLVTFEKLDQGMFHEVQSHFSDTSCNILRRLE